MLRLDAHFAGKFDDHERSIEFAALDDRAHTQAPLPTPTIN